MRIKPFKALRPPAEQAAQVASLPYDVGSLESARAEAQANPLSFLHVERPEVDLPDGAAVTSDVAHGKALENFSAFRAQGHLVQDEQASLFVYQLTLGEHRQSGIITVCNADDYRRGIIRRHEKTRKHTEDERTQHISVLNANTGPIFLIHRDQPEIDAEVARIESGDPMYDFTAPDGIRHTVWRVPRADVLVRLFSAVPVAYVADGHHRAAAAARVARQRRKDNPGHRGDEEYNWFLVVLFPASQVRVLPYNRCVLDLNGLSPDQFLEKVKDQFVVSEGASPRPAQPGQISMYLEGRWFGLGWTPGSDDDPVSKLDASVLQDRLLGPVLDIRDPRNNAQIEYVGGLKSVDELVERVDLKKALAGFSMYPTAVEQLMTIADAHQIMPPKSTWFEPKLRSGLFVHMLD